LKKAESSAKNATGQQATSRCLSGSPWADRPSATRSPHG
jgi:hypothetical protein